MSQARTEIAMACDYCGRTGAMKARATSNGRQVRLFCHTAERSCFNECRGRYFEPCRCTRSYDKGLTEEHESWTITRKNPACGLHITATAA